MAKDASFDVVSEVDRQEVDNALNQARKELQQRFDFKGTDAKIEWTDKLKLEISANAEHRVTAALDVFKEKIVKRHISLKALQTSPVKPTGGGGFKIEVEINQGIADEKAREIVKTVKAANIKGLQVAIQGEQLRVSGKSRDSLQEAIQVMKDKDFGIPLQFVNYR
jgi:cyclic-di-GMP-binding protein